MNEASRRVLSTYRLQLHAGFDFDAAAGVLPYLAALGVSHVYLSPVTAAAAGSAHGYDVIDPTVLNLELGGAEAYERLVAEQRRLGLGQLLDVVPNHMGIAPGSDNRYWEDVLRLGPDSAYAGLFDVEWDTPPRGRVVLPILGAELDDVIAHGDLEVDRRDEGWLLLYGNRLPLRPGSLEDWQGDDPRDLLALQHYRLEYWRAGQETLDYRRFFAIDDLIGVRAEDPEVFGLVHRLPLELVARGDVDGLRIDHVDGLRDPAAYLEHLRARLSEVGRPGTYVVVEKILEADEPLPDWACAGTTGYDAMNELSRVLLSPAHVERFDALERRVTGREEPYEVVAAEGRAHVVRELLGGQFARLATRLWEAARPPGVAGSDFAEALLTLLAHIEPYRTYHRGDALDPLAATVVGRAADEVTGGSTDVAPPAIEAARRLLAAPPEGAAREAVLSLQQIQPAVQAKGIEDRVLFRFRRLMALNEVGGDPALFGEDVEAFHRRMRDRAERWPHRMLATATHDHKLGEDVRARLTVLSEAPDLWEHSVDAGLAALDALQGTTGPRVHPADAYLLLQLLAGAMPSGLRQGREGDDAFEGRLSAYLVKALREAGERTAWIGGDEAYEEAMTSLAMRALTDDDVRNALGPLMRVIVPAGAVNGLAQAVLKLAAPGVPDTYQGNELWDLSLVDPDNRRAVDFRLRQRLLGSIEGASPESLVRSWRDGGIKLAVTARLLHARREHPALFALGAYEPIAVQGARADHVVAYARKHGDEVAVVAVPRWPATLTGRAEELWQPDWGDTRLDLGGTDVREWTDVVGGRRIDTESLDAILGTLPVAVLLAERSG